MDPPLHNPAIKGIIFNVDSLENPSIDWIDTYKEVSCMSKFDTTTWSSFTKYVFGATQSHSTNMNFQTDPGYEEEEKAEPFTYKTKVPPIFSRGHGSNESASHMEEHYKKHEGSVSHGEARCNVYAVTVYPDNPNVRLTENFQNRIKEIDLAASGDEKDAAMKTFIQEFGTHYGKKTTMGVGLKFESRWRKEESKFNSETKLNRCNTRNGAKFFGMQLEDDTEDCIGTSLDVSEGQVNGLTRLSASSYGSYPREKLSDWQTAIETLDANGKLDPLPISQEYDLILNLLLTPAVKAIKHSNGESINTTNIMKTAIEGYAKYCYLANDKNLCQIFGCAKSVRIGDMVFNYASTDDAQNRLIFQEWTTSKTKHQLFFKDNHWLISEGPWDETPKVKSTMCPLNGTTFVNPIIVFQQETLDWQKCSIKCSEMEACYFWQYKIVENRCQMIESFESMSDTLEKTYIGTKDCPGAIDLRNSMFGSCVENHPSMWTPGGEAFFQKGLKVEENDPTVLVLGGGLTLSLGVAYPTDSVEVIGDYECPVPMQNLPIANDFHTMAMTPDGTVLSCGGRDNNVKDCLTYDTNIKEWTKHSSLNKQRMAASAVTLPNGVYILGGINEALSSEILPKGSTDWIDGPTLPMKVKQSCAIAISNTEFHISGGGIKYNFQNEAYKYSVKYDVETETWTRWTDLKEARFGHGCAKLGNKIVIAGGRDTHGYTESTEIIDLASGKVKYGGNLQRPRMDFQMSTLGGHYQRILAVGGLAHGLVVDDDVDTIEEWNDDNESWSLHPDKLKTARHRFGALAVPKSRIC